MKNIRHKIVLLLIIMLTVACEDFLDKNPLDKMSNETFWTSETEVEMALTGCYARLTDENFFGYKGVDLDALTDNAQHKYNDDENGWILKISRGEIETTTYGLIEDIWNSSYAGISTCNNFLANVDKAPITDIAANNYKAEVRFLRAFFYFNLVHYFGDVIIYTNMIVTPDQGKIAQSPKSEVLKLIHEDLDFAIQYLSEDQYSGGHAVQGSALGLKARVLMYEENWRDAVSVTQKIIQSGVYSLSPNYQEIFVKSQQNNPEILFSTRYLNPDNYSELDIELALWGTIMPRQELADEYECIDGLPITESPLYDTANPYVNRDPRLDMTLVTPDEVWYNPDSTIHSPDPSYTGFYQEKYVNKENLPITTSTRSEQDYIHLRFADVLLMFAEAQNELTGPNDSVYYAINSVRGREGVNMPEIESGLNQNEMRTKIRHERRIELALEGLRYYDLKRWKIAHEVMPLVKDVGGATINFENPKHYLWPYQKTELDVNPNLIPNPDYVY